MKANLRVLFTTVISAYIIKWIVMNYVETINIYIHGITFFIYSYISFLVLFKVVQYYKSLPPGPWGLPFVGYLLFMLGKPPHTLYMKLAERYGDVFSVQLGSNLVVCLGSTKLMKEFFNRPDSIGRPHTPLNSLLGGFGIILSEGTLWKRQRQFLHEKFRMLGVKLCPNQQFEKYIIMEIEELLQRIDEQQSKPVIPSDLLGRHVHNVICQLIMSVRFQEKDEEFTKFNERVTRGMKLYGDVHIGEHMKYYLKLPGKADVIKEMKRNLADISKFHGDHITERAKHGVGTGKDAEPADLLDHYLEKVEERDKLELKNNIFHDADPEKQIVQVMNDLFSAGMETVLTTLVWAMLMMIKEPTVMKNVRVELRKVVAPGHLVTLENRLALPYIEAVLFETMRVASIVPLGTTHVNTNTWKINNYTIPVGTHIIPLIIRMNQDPEIYPDPQKFQPERFVKDGRFYSTDNFMQFGYGQRSCLGLTLARMEMFLFFANIMNHYDFFMPDGEDPPGLDGVLGVTHSPLPFNLVFKKLNV